MTVDPETLAHPTLFCWCVAMTVKRGARQLNSEAELMSKASKLNTGVFQCNKWVVFSNEEVSLGNGRRTTLLPGPMSKKGDVPNLPPGNKMLLNTDVFFRAWDKVLQGGLFRGTEWTAKLDPDAVFFPARLRQHLTSSHADPHALIYFKNCQKWGSMQGPVELFSTGAMEVFASRMWECKNNVDQTKIGEDIFMQKCTVNLGMQGREDWSLLHDQYCNPDNAPCNDPWMVAFHPYKGVETYEKCYNEAVGATAWQKKQQEQKQKQQQQNQWNQQQQPPPQQNQWNQQQQQHPPQNQWNQQQQQPQNQWNQQQQQNQWNQR